MIAEFKNLWIEKYRPVVLSDLLLSKENEQIIQTFVDKQEIPHLILLGSPGLGKAQPLTSKILTPTGWVTMGEIKVGQLISTPDGKSAPVREVYPQGKKSVFVITLWDGRQVECCYEHLWRVWKPLRINGQSRFRWQTLQLSQLLDVNLEKQRVYIPLVLDTISEKKVLPIPPYVLGCILGDGGVTGQSVNFTCADTFIVDQINKELDRDTVLKKSNTKTGIDYTFVQSKDATFKFGHIQKHYTGKYCDHILLKNKISHNINVLKLRGCKSENKFIPSVYKTASTAQKIQLIQGLMDTNGTVAKGRTLQYGSTSKQLIDDMVQILWSIGATTRVRVWQPYYTYKNQKLKGQIAYTLSFRHPTREMFVRLPRKKEKISKNYQYQDLKLRIKSIVKKPAAEECQCILVDSQDHLYVTDNYIVTHNTSLAKILVNDVLKCQYLYINASDENGIDTIRNKVTNFARTKSIDGKIKVIILDEADAGSPEFQRALRNTIEELSSITRFVLTGNYKHKIIPALLSRCQSIELTVSVEAVVRRCYSILKQENVILTDETRKTFFAFVKKTYPDIRKCISELQKYSVNGALILKEDSFDELFESIYKTLSIKDVLTVRKLLIEQEAKFNGDYVNLLRNLFNYIDKVELDLEVRRKRLVIIADAIYKSSFVIDQEINCYACCIQLAN